MESTAIEGAITDDLGHDQQTPSLHAIARCPKSLERCLHRLLDLLGAYWEEFRGPGGSTLATLCNSFAAAARGALRTAAVAMPNCSPHRFDVETNAPADVRDVARFMDILDQAIDTRKQGKEGDIELAVEAVRMATSLVQEIPWSGLPEQTLAQNHDLLKWMVKRISSLRKGWNDKNYIRLVRRLIRADPTILVDLAKEPRRHDRAY